MSGAGSIVGSVLALRWAPARKLLVGLVFLIPWTLGHLVFALHWPLPAVFLVAFAGGVGIGLFIVWWETTLAQEIPPAALSRVAAFDWMGSLGLLPVGYLLAGPIAASVGATETLAVGCDAVLCASAISRAEDPVAMAHAIRLGVEGGRLAREAGRIPRRLYGEASTPTAGVPDFG